MHNLSVFVTNQRKIIETKLVRLTKRGKLNANSVSLEEVHNLSPRDRKRQTELDKRRCNHYNCVSDVKMDGSM